jgi:hypothetical protein
MGFASGLATSLDKFRSCCTPKLLLSLPASLSHCCHRCQLILSLRTVPILLLLLSPPCHPSQVSPSLEYLIPFLCLPLRNHELMHMEERFCLLSKTQAEQWSMYSWPCSPGASFEHPMELELIQVQLTHTGLPFWCSAQQGQVLWTGAGGSWLHLGTLANLVWEGLDRFLPPASIWLQVSQLRQRSAPA